MSRTLGSTDEFERRMRMVGQQPSPDNPLAELARLVGQEDPFRNLTPPPREAVRHTAPVATSQALDVARTEPYRAAAARDRENFAAFDHEFGGGLRAAEDAGAPDEPAVVHGLVGATAPRPAPSYSNVAIDRQRPLEPSPDVWAQGQSQTDTPDLVATRDGEAHRPAGGSSRRTLVVLAAVVVLTGGGLAASFLARPSGGMVAASSAASAPTIMAAAGPSKVQPVTTPADSDATSNSTLLDKNAGDGTATAKVVNTVEQPVDLAQAVKPSAPTAAAEEVRPNQNGFPEPKKVRTVTVRPDGTIVANAPAGTAAQGGVTDGEPASLAFDPRMSVPPPAAPDPTPVPMPAVAAETPAPVAPVKTTTRVPAGAIAATETGVGAADGQSVTATTRPKPAARVPKVKPTDIAAATAPDAVASTPGGGYAVQLGAPPSEAEAKDVSARLMKKFAQQLGSYQPTIRQAESGSRSVYRIRVANLSQEDAKALCAKLQAGGGGCFVVRN